MTQAYKYFSIVPAELLPSRQTFLEGATDSPDILPARMDLLNLNESGAPDEENVYLKVDVLHIQSIQLSQQERMQPCINSSDDGQIYFFGRENRVYQVSSFIVDSDLTAGQGYKVDKAFRGHLLGRWKKLYEDQLRITRTVKDRRVVRIQLKTIDLFGHILSSVASLDSAQPFQCQVGIMFLSVYERDRANIPVIDGGRGAPVIPGLLTREAWLKLFPDIPVQLAVGESAVELLATRRSSVPPSE